MIAPISRPGRLHHHAFVSRDQEATRRFYEEIVGLPLVATWCEENEAGAYCHTFYELADGSCLAFFQFADAALNESHAKLASPSPFDHVALAATDAILADVTRRAEGAGVATFAIDHGYCRSLYLRDPDGLVVELTVDDPRALAEAPARRASARADLARWLAGDRTPINALRGDEAAP
ncbi:MAG: VOC family protein [Proteobacteria bacterium]|nr:MAG: VOC family protein [Pseudomonadota bacterium]